MLDQFSINDESKEKEKTVVPFHNISAKTFSLMIEFLKGFNQFVELNIPITFDNCTVESVFGADPFQVTYFSAISDLDLKDLVEAANFIDCPTCMESCMAAIAIQFKIAQINYSRDMGMSDDEIRYQRRPLPGMEELDEELQKEYAQVFSRLDDEEN